MKSFEARLQRPEGTGTWTYLDVPFSVPDEFGSKGQVKVKATVNGVPYRSSLLPRGDGTHYLVVGKPIRDQANAAEGDTVRVTIEPDTEPRSVSVPADLAQALAADAAAHAAFAGLAYSHRKAWVEWIEAARQEETRRRRIASAVERIARGERQR